MPLAIDAVPTVEIVDHDCALHAVSQVNALATLPEITARIIATVADPRSTAAQLHKLVSNDPALVTRILKMVNSSFYGLPGRIASVDRAVVLLGLNAVRNLAVAASMGQLFRGPKICDGFTPKDLWTHCIAVAVASRELARQIKPSIIEEAFLAGMIHDVGLLVWLQLWPAQLEQVCQITRRDNRPFHEVEAEVMGIDHQQLGRALTQRWNFPTTCQSTAAYHHAPEKSAPDDHLLVEIVHHADRICCQSRHGFNLTCDPQSSASTEINPAMNRAIEHVTTQLDILIAEASPLL